MESEIQKNLVIALNKAIKTNYQELDLSNIIITIDIPKNNENGDYASNIAMQLSRILKKNPLIIAKEIVAHLDIISYNIERVEIANPGFINLFMTKGSLGNQIKNILELKDQYGKSDIGNNQSYNVEFVSANPTGDLHLGHARQAALGDSICRILTQMGYSVTREYYINDAGNQVHNLALSLKARYNQIINPDYPMPDDGYQGKDIILIANQLYEEYKDKYLNDESESAYLFFKSQGIHRELMKLRKDLLYFRVKFNIWSSEQAIREKGFVEKALKELNQRGFLYQSEGATWFKSTVFGDDKDRVIIKNDGSYTYLMPDIAYHIKKLSRKYDYLVDLLGADHHGYIPRMKAAIQALGYPANKLSIEIVQMVRLIKDGAELKMSKRTGNAVTIRELCEEVGIDAVRYFFVSRSASAHLDFDLDLASSKSSENPVYYAQYAHARICRILQLAKKRKLHVAGEFNLLNQSKEIDLIKILLEYPSFVIDAGKTLAPYKITNYIQKLAQSFHAFYNDCKVIDSDNEKLSAQRLGLVEATKIVIKNALNLVGVKAPVKM